MFVLVKEDRLRSHQRLNPTIVISGIRCKKEERVIKAHLIITNKIFLRFMFDGSLSPLVFNLAVKILAYC